MLSRLHAGERRRRMHVVGDPYGACIDVVVLFFEHYAEVCVLRLLAVSLEILRSALLVDVTERDDIFGLGHFVQDAAALAAAADCRDIQLVVVRFVPQRL